MSVRELIQQLSKIENQDLEVVYGDIDYENFPGIDFYLWNLDYPSYEIKDGTTVVNIGCRSDNAITIIN
jgi:hypothetical protein